MAKTPRSTPTRSGPGRGTPRSRTAARPGERSGAHRSRPRTVDPAPEGAARGEVGTLPVAPQRSRAIGVTWRLLVLAVVVAAIAVSLAQSLRVYFVQAEEIAQLHAEIQARQDEIADLEDQIERWQDPDYVRAMARERLGWVMPGETGYRVIGADGEALGGEHDILGADEIPGTWWERMWGSVTLADQPVEVEDGEPGAEQEPSPTPESSR